MPLIDFKQFPWIMPWRAISPRGREAYEHELRLEAVPGHPLYQVPCRAIARSGRTDDVLFELIGHAATLAVVHLTFTGRPEREPKWPATTLYASIEQWVSRCMMPDAARFEIERSKKAA